MTLGGYSRNASFYGSFSCGLSTAIGYSDWDVGAALVAAVLRVVFPTVVIIVAHYPCWLVTPTGILALINNRYITTQCSKLHTADEQDGFRDARGFALYGGNSNNGSNCGSYYCNLNNTVGNSNWNIGAE